VTKALRAMQTLADTMADTPSMAATEKSKYAIDSRDGACTGDEGQERAEEEEEEGEGGSSRQLRVGVKNSGPAAFRRVNTARHQIT
jgi:hypothetical protein